MFPRNEMRSINLTSGQVVSDTVQGLHRDIRSRFEYRRFPVTSMLNSVQSRVAGPHSHLTPDEIRSAIAETFPTREYREKRVLVIVSGCDTDLSARYYLRHPLRSDCRSCIGIRRYDRSGNSSTDERAGYLQDDWKSLLRNAAQLIGACSSSITNGIIRRVLLEVGTISAAEIETLTNGRFATDVLVNINRRVFDYDQIIIAGPVFPHEVVGFSGGNKYLFPGVSGPEVLNFFHWLGAVITNPMIIGNKHTPVRAIIDRAAAMVEVPKVCLCMVVDKGQLVGLFAGSPEAAWEQASDLSRTFHITYKDRPFHTVLSCAPKMYTELWVGGKCMYKLEPVVADGGELIDICSAHTGALAGPWRAYQNNRIPLSRLFSEAVERLSALSLGSAGAFYSRARDRNL